MSGPFLLSMVVLVLSSQLVWVWAYTCESRNLTSGTAQADTYDIMRSMHCMFNALLVIFLLNWLCPQSLLCSIWLLYTTIQEQFTPTPTPSNSRGSWNSLTALTVKIKTTGTSTNVQTIHAHCQKTNTHACTHARTHTHAHTNRHTHNTHTCSHTQTHTPMHTHTATHTQVRYILHTHTHIHYKDNLSC